MHLKLNRALLRLIWPVALAIVGGPVSAQQLLFTTSSPIAANDRVMRMNVIGNNGGTNIFAGTPSFNNPNGVAVDLSAGKFFVADGNGTNSIRAGNLNSTGSVTNLVAVGINISGLALDTANQKIYFTTSSTITNNDRIMRVNYDGTGLTTLFSAGILSNANGIALDLGTGKIFVADASGVKEANLNGTGSVTNLYASGTNVSAVALDTVHQKVYFTYSSPLTTSRIMRINYDGTGITNLFSASANLVNPTGLTLDVTGGKIYLSDGNTANVIEVANLDGTGTPAKLYAAGMHISGISGVQNLLTITGTVSNQATLDTGSVSLFSGVTVSDYNTLANLSVTLQLDNTAKGSFTSLGGFSNLGGGSYSYTGVAASVTSALHSMVYKPTANRVPRGLTETSFFTLSVNDGSLPVIDTNTTVVSTAANHPPVANPDRFDHPAKQPMTIPVSNVLTNDTDADGDTLTVQSVDAASTLGVPVSLSGTNILYGATTNLALDTFHYVENDAHGGTATGLVTMTTSLASLSLVGTNKVLNFTRSPNLTYRIQDNTNLATTNWLTLTSILSDASGHFAYTNLGPTNKILFYRAVNP